MIILGIHDGHNSGASIFKDGIMLVAISEEKLTRNKNEYGYPEYSVKKCLEFTNIKNNQIDFVAVSTKYLPPKYFLVKRNTTFKIEDYLKEQKKYWYQKIYENKKVLYTSLFKDKLISKKNFLYDNKFFKNEDDVLGMQKARRMLISKKTKVSLNKIEFFDHHECHAYYGYYGSDIQRKKVVIVTADGGGDNTNGSIWIASKNKLIEKYRTNICNVGRIYRYVTLILGMKPTEHEFKVMGMAGYGIEKSHFYDKVIKIFKNTLNVNSFKFKYKYKPKDNFFYFKSKLDGLRFDTVAFGLQKFTEDLLLKWFQNIHKKFKCNNFIFSGGVAQNIKATQKILEDNSVSSIFIPPGPGDESLCIGAAYCKLSRLGFQKSQITNMINPYVGMSFQENALKFIFKDKKLKIKKTNNKKIAKLLSNGEIVARFSLDKNEFGPRALGNRSILADPRRSDILNIINKKIKVRDFWMPFAPSVIDKDLNKFFIIRKNHKPYFMTTACNTTELGRRKIPAAIHPFDKTARPQLVLKKYNHSYDDLINEFKKISGVGVILNTSFNLHGEPIVFTPKDAIKTLKKSGLKYLYIGNYLVEKKI
jgi:carbamoyltransferase